jgi:very-short-patch-repair endonuclease
MTKFGAGNKILQTAQKRVSWAQGDRMKDKINNIDAVLTEERVLQVLGYKHKLITRQTEHEKKFYRLLLEAREINESQNKQRNTIHKQHIFIEGRTAYIADFYLPNYKLVFEIDGMHHKNQKEYDSQRTKFINEKGIKVVRFWNYELDAPNIIEMIIHSLKHKKR